MACFPKTAHLLRSRDFRKVYEHGAKYNGPLFTAFCLRAPESETAGSPGPRVGFTVPRAIGGSVARNRIRRRMREAVREHLHLVGNRWDIVFNPRRRVLTAPFPEVLREVERFFRRYGGVPQSGSPPSSGSISS